MASKQRMSHSPTDVHLRKTQIMRPIISSDVMGNRNVEVVPVGAWVELVDDDEQPDAVVSMLANQNPSSLLSCSGMRRKIF